MVLASLRLSRYDKLHYWVSTVILPVLCPRGGLVSLWFSHAPPVIRTVYRAVLGCVASSLCRPLRVKSQGCPEKRPQRLGREIASEVVMLTSRSSIQAPRSRQETAHQETLSLLYPPRRVARSSTSPQVAGEHQEEDQKDQHKMATGSILTDSFAILRCEEEVGNSGLYHQNTLPRTPRDYVVGDIRTP